MFAIAVGSVAAALIVHDRRKRQLPPRAARRGRTGGAPGRGGRRPLGRASCAAPRPSSRPRRGRPQPPRVRPRSRARCCAQPALHGRRLRRSGCRWPSAPPTNARHGVSRSSKRGPDGGLRAGGAARRSTTRSPTSQPRRAAAARRSASTSAPNPTRGRCSRSARDTGKPVATPVLPLLLGGHRGRRLPAGLPRRGADRDGRRAPRRPDRVRRRQLPARATSPPPASRAVPDAVDLQLRTSDRLVAGARGALEDPARAPFNIANQTWVLVVRDPNRPDVELPLLLGVGRALPGRPARRADLRLEPQRADARSCSARPARTR